MDDVQNNHPQLREGTIWIHGSKRNNCPFRFVNI